MKLNYRTMTKPKREALEQMFEVQGNGGGNYLKIGKFKDGDNRLFVEIGDCCVVIFRGIITVEVFTNFLTQASFEKNGLLETMRSKIAWDEEVNEKYYKGCKELAWHEVPSY